MSEKLYQHPQEKWTRARCEKVRKARGSDGLGTPHPYRGLVQSDSSARSYYGTQRFNGGTIIAGDWYPGYHRPWPRLPKGWQFLRIPSWGVYLARTNESARDLACF